MLHLVNNHYMTLPGVAHKPGPRSFEVWNTLSRELLTRRRSFHDQPELAIYTWSSRHNESHLGKVPLFRRSCEYAGVTCTELGETVDWHPAFKIETLLDALKEQRELKFLAVDNWDGLLLADPTVIYRRLEREPFNESLVFNACPWAYPEHEPTDTIATEQAPSDTLWKYLNSGIIAGDVDTAIQFLEEVLIISEEYWIDGHEQLPCQMKAIEYPDICKIDYHCEHFQIVTGGHALSQVQLLGL